MLRKEEKHQNSGVIIIQRQQVSSAKDKNLVVGNATYFGVLKEIIDMLYFGQKKIVLFKWDWVVEGKDKKSRWSWVYLG